MKQVASVTVEISPGELIDRLTILELKAERIVDAGKAANVELEKKALSRAYERAIPSHPQLVQMRAELRAVNAQLWDAEDGVREAERAGDFGPHFIALARSIYTLNDWRGRLKRDIDHLLGARFHEEKSHLLPDADER